VLAGLLAVRLPVDLRALGIGYLPTDETDDIAIFEVGDMSIAEDDVAWLNPRSLAQPEKLLCVAVIVGNCDHELPVADRGW
jgi:hypothetical protein